MDARWSHARRLVPLLFVSNGVAWATWAAHVPTVSGRLGLDPGALGLALLAPGAAAIMVIPLTGRLMRHRGSAFVARASTTVFIAGLAVLLLAPTVPALVGALLLFGAANGAMDVSMNAQAIAVEQRLGRPIMSSFHGMFSLGALLGAAGAAATMAAGVSTTAHVAGVAVTLAALALATFPALVDAPREGSHGAPALAAPRGAVVVLGLMAMLALMAEGAMADWSALYFRRSLGADASVAALGFAAFSCAMAAGRFAGDAIRARVGAVALVRASGGLAAASLATALAIGHPAAAIAGCAGMGLGLSNLVPLLFGAAGALDGATPAEGLAAVTTCGYVGYVAGPPLIGLLAEATTLALGLGLVAACTAAVAACARAVARPSRPGATARTLASPAAPV
jgi:predicted MFS family arabinose efflux permease